MYIDIRYIRYSVSWGSGGKKKITYSHCMILARFFTRLVLINRRKILDIGGKSVLVHTSDNHAVWIKDVIWGHRQISGAVGDSQSCCVNEFWLKKIHQWWPTANERATYNRLEARGGLFFFFSFFLQIKRLAIYKQRAYILALEYTDQVGYITMKKGLELFL